MGIESLAACVVGIEILGGYGDGGGGTRTLPPILPYLFNNMAINVKTRASKRKYIQWL